MDHKEQHHEHHRHERAEAKREQKRHEDAEMKKGPPIHPAWLWGAGVVAVLVAMAVWSFILR
jgi:hypothetical protein